jgi:hypothetical protein
LYSLLDYSALKMFFDEFDILPCLRAFVRKGSGLGAVLLFFLHSLEPCSELCCGCGIFSFGLPFLLFPCGRVGSPLLALCYFPFWGVRADVQTAFTIACQGLVWSSFNCSLSGGDTWRALRGAFD